MRTFTLRGLLAALDPRRRRREAGADAPGVLFVCANNICRSPIAEVVLRTAAARAGLAQRLRIDSAGMHGVHAGEPPDPRAVRAARSRGYDLTRVRARQFVREDFARFDWIYAMDTPNLRLLENLRPAGFGGHLGRYLDVVPALASREVPDPYYGGLSGFEHVLDLAEAATAPLLTVLEREVRSARPDARRAGGVAT